MVKKLDSHSINAGKEDALSGRSVPQDLLEEGYYHKASYLKSYKKNGGEIKEYQKAEWKQ